MNVSRRISGISRKFIDIFQPFIFSRVVEAFYATPKVTIAIACRRQVSMKLGRKQYFAYITGTEAGALFLPSYWLPFVASRHHYYRSSLYTASRASKLAGSYHYEVKHF